MATSWFRKLAVDTYQNRWQYIRLFGLSPGDTLLRTYVSWHAMGDEFSTNEALFCGVQVLQGQPAPGFPDDPMQSVIQLSGEWLAGEMHAPVRDPQQWDLPHRNVWPASGHRLWDIEANRKPSVAGPMAFYMVYALPQESSGQVEMRLYVAALINSG